MLSERNHAVARNARVRDRESLRTAANAARRLSLTRRSAEHCVEDQKHDDARRPGDRAGYGIEPQLLLAFGDADGAVDDPEEAVVEVGVEERADAGGECCEDRVHREVRDDRRRDRRRRDHCHGAAALDEADEGRDEERQQDGGNARLQHGFGDDRADTAVADQHAEGAAAARDEDDDARRLNARLHFFQDALPVEAARQTVDREQKTDADGDDRRAEELDDVGDLPLHAHGGGHRTDEDQEDRCEDRRERDERRWQVCIVVDAAVAARCDIRFIARPAAFRRRDLPDLLSRPLRKEQRTDDHRHGKCETPEDQRADADFEDARDAHGTGRRRHHRMRDDEAGGERDADGDDGLARFRRNRLCQRRQDDEARITENRNGNEEARQSHGDLLAPLAEELEEAKCHALCGAGNFEELPHHDAEADDDADAPERAAEALRDARDDLLEFDAAEHTDKYGCQDQRQKRVNLGLHNHENQAGNTNAKTYENLRFCSHEDSSPCS